MLRPLEWGWMVTSGNISTGSDFGKFPFDPFHHQLTPLSLSPGKSQPRRRWFQTEQQACNYRAISGSKWGEIPPSWVQTLLKRCIFGGVLGVEGMVQGLVVQRIEQLAIRILMLLLFKLILNQLIFNSFCLFLWCQQGMKIPSVQVIGQYSDWKEMPTEKIHKSIKN